MVRIYARLKVGAPWELVGKFTGYNGKAILNRYKKAFPSYLFKMVED